MTKKTLKLYEALEKEWPYPNFAFIKEFRGGTGWTVESRADAIAMDLWPSRGLELVGFEVKTSRADWLRELKQEGKADPIKQFCDKWYLVVDNYYDVLHYGEGVPEDWGVMAMNYMGKIDVKKEAPKLEPKPIDRNFLAALMRRASKPFDEVWIEDRRYVAANLSTTPPQEI